MDYVKKLLHHEAAGGVLLILAATAAMIIANSPLGHSYHHVLHEMTLGLSWDHKESVLLTKSLGHWVNDGLMVVFFFHVGLELKREIMEGELSDPKQIALPGIAAVGGVAVPALVFYFFNKSHGTTNGWAVPTATDIAFALGILSLLGKNVPPSLKLFLLTLAIMDDLAGILIIAIFYSSGIDAVSLEIAGVLAVILFWMNKKNVYQLAPYLFVGFIVWLCFLKSGVHATIAGVVLAFFIPLRVKGRHRGFSPLKRLEKDLHPLVAFVILPVFAFSNTGVHLEGVSVDLFLAPVTLGIAAGLIFGKVIGVFGFTWLAVKLKLATLPKHSTWRDMFGLSMLTGIGFTMSIFIASLAFEKSTEAVKMNAKIGILVGTIVSAVAGYFWLKASLKAGEREEISQEEIIKKKIIF